ncbi:MAG TPA: 2-dehydropantoate 2-reductase [Longimicrobiales bacterium]|nr:2-dehydropantoate 2-reductase [Longimicrobiales bacterium]
MRFVVLGAGGVGGYYGAMLARAGHDVAFLARGAHLDAIRSDGLRVHSPDGDFVVHPAATDDPAALPAADAVLVTVKSYSLEEAAPAAARLAAGGATVVPLLNGVDAADRLAELGVPREAILGGVTYLSAARTAPGVIERRSPFQRVVVGELGGGSSERAERIAGALRDAGVEAAAVPDIDVQLWRKLVFLAPLAAACGLARAPIGAVRARPLGPLLLERLVGETAAVARARGVALPPGEEARTLEQIRGLPDGMRPSYLLDLEAGGPTELDLLSGAISRIGRELGVPTPVHDTAAAVLR